MYLKKIEDIKVFIVVVVYRMSIYSNLKMQLGNIALITDWLEMQYYDIRTVLMISYPPVSSCLKLATSNWLLLQLQTGFSSWSLSVSHITFSLLAMPSLNIPKYPKNIPKNPFYPHFPANHLSF